MSLKGWETLCQSLQPRALPRTGVVATFAGAVHWPVTQGSVSIVRGPGEAQWLQGNVSAFPKLGGK